MKKAILYSRVATNTQANENRSLTNQQNSMIKFCKSNSIEVESIFADTASGSNLDRSAFQKMKAHIKKNYTKIDYILVTDWDRFARNIEEALVEISRFQKLGIEVNSSTSWVDMKAEPVNNKGAINKHGLKSLLGKENAKRERGKSKRKK